METVVEPKPLERLPWHKPEVRRIEVNLDTEFEGGSNIDLHDGSVFP
jgi:hypothetical protein